MDQDWPCDQGFLGEEEEDEEEGGSSTADLNDSIAFKLFGILSCRWGVIPGHNVFHCCIKSDFCGIGKGGAFKMHALKVYHVLPGMKGRQVGQVFVF